MVAIVKIILNEKEYAERCLKTGEIDEKPFRTLQILAKYYYHILAYRKKRITKLLTEYMQNNYDRYNSNINSWNDTIEKIAAKAGKYTLCEISEIWITENELKTIDNIEGDIDLKALAFTFLCLAKLGNAKNNKNNGWVNYKTKDVFDLAHISANINDQDTMIGYLRMMGLIELPKKNDNLSNRVTFVDDDSTKILRIDDFRGLRYAYLKYKGENIVKCLNCGVLMKGNKAGTKKYCSDCATYTPQITKKIKCIDCGMEFETDSKNNRSLRCPECYETHRKSQVKENVQRYREKHIM